MNNIFVTCDMHGRTIHAIAELRPGCFYTHELALQLDVPPTPEELAVDAAMDAAYEKAARDYYGDDYNYEYRHDLYRTEAAAKRAAQLHAAFAATHEDLEAYSAPSECGAIAYRDLQAEHEALEAAFAVRPAPNPYTERGLEDRTRPVGELLFGESFGRMVSDHDVLTAMGERPALG